MRIYLVFLALLALTVGRSESAVALKLGDNVGAVSLTTLEGHPRVMNNYGDRRGTVVVFLSARCDTTHALIGDMAKVYGKYRLRENLFVGVCSNPEESGEELRAFCQRQGVLFPVYRDPDGSVAKQFGATHTPESFLLDASGNLIYHGELEGPQEKAGLEAAIVALLGKKPIAAPETPVTGTPLNQPGAKREIDDPYGTISFSSELIFTRIPGASVHHCAAIAEAPNGDLLCLWYGGSYESAEDQVLFLARLKKGAGIWSTPEVVVRNPDQPPGNAIIFQDHAQRMCIMWGRMEGSRPVRRGAGWSQCRLLTRYSTDNGVTWSADQELPDSFAWLPRNAPITLQSGELAIPLSGAVDKKYGGFLLVTSDNGTSWKRLGFMPRCQQPSVIQRANGELLALARSEPYVLRSESKDGGATWSSPEKTELKCPGSGVALLRLNSGRLILLHNDNNANGDRTPLVIQQSYDEGQTWTDRRVLEQDWGEFSYPYAIQASDGMIHMTYTYRRYSIKHVAIDEGWLTHLERPN